MPDGSNFVVGVPGSDATMTGTCEQFDFVADIGFSPISDTRAREWKKRFVGWNPERQRRLHYGIAQWRYRELGLIYSAEHRLRSEPYDIRRIARKVAAVRPDSVFGYLYFDSDPLLYAEIEGKRYCLGIWHGGVVRAIADNQFTVKQKIYRYFAATV